LPSLFFLLDNDRKILRGCQDSSRHSVAEADIRDRRRRTTNNPNSLKDEKTIRWMNQMWKRA